MHACVRVAVEGDEVDKASSYRSQAGLGPTVLVEYDGNRSGKQVVARAAY